MGLVFAANGPTLRQMLALKTTVCFKLKFCIREPYEICLLRKTEFTVFKAIAMANGRMRPMSPAMP